MMQPRCAVCDGDGQLQTLCDLHFWLRIWRYCVDSGDFSDWPPLVASETEPVQVNHRDMLLRPAVAPLYWQTMLAVALSGKGALLARTPEDSAGDWLAVNGLLDFGATDGGKGRAA